MKILFSFILLLMLGACDEEEARYEKIDKLRALGVAVNPVAAIPSTPTAPVVSTLTYYFAAPTADALSATTFTDPAAGNAFFVDLNIADNLAAPTELNGLYLHTVTATTPIPSADLLQIPDDLGFARLNYGLEVNLGSENEKVVGKILVFKPDSDKVGWTAPDVSITEPAEGASIAPGEIDLKATITSDYEEQWRVAWFASDGKIQNRRAINTKWETPGSGEHSLILTVRGLNSNTFVIKTLKVKF